MSRAEVFRRKFIFISEFSVTTPKAATVFQSAKMCATLAAAGHSVEFWVRKGTEIAEADLADFFNLPRNFSVKKIPIGGKSAQAYPGRPTLAWLYWRLLWYAFFLKEDRKKIVYTRDVFAAWIFAINGYFSCLELHFAPENRLVPYGFFLKPLSRVICLTASIKEKILKFDFPEKKTLCLGSAVDEMALACSLSRAAAKKQAGVPEEAFILGYVGLLRDREKVEGMEIILTAVAQLPAHFYLLVVGGLPAEVAHYQALSRHLGVAHRVKFVGYQKRKFLPDFYRALDLGLAIFDDSVHSRRAVSSLKILEYMAAEVPVVASDIPTVRHFLNEENAWLAPPGSAALLARTIERAAADAEWQKKIKQAKIDVAKFSWLKRVAALEAFIGKE